ncbi:hypothetical protein ACI65C_003875, partial [Semiaphis heraclei]
VKMLAMIGASNFKESVRRILRKLISNDYAKSFSYTGHKNNKTAFNNTILASLLTSEHFKLFCIHNLFFNIYNPITSFG